MATLPVRNLGQLGILPDVDPYALPLNAFSKGSNVIFDEGRVQRAPVFKTLYTGIKDNISIDSLSGSVDSLSGFTEDLMGSLSSSQRFLAAYALDDQEVVLVCDTTGTVREYKGGVHRQVTPSGIPVSNSNPWAHTQAAGLSVLSRKGMVPQVRNLQTESFYGPFRNSWPSTDTCSVVRAFGDYLIAINLVKDGVEYPTTVRWCHPLQYAPNTFTGIDWDYQSTENLAGENLFAAVTTPLIDGLPLNNVFVVYSKDQVWSMEPTASRAVFNYRRLFSKGGIISVNCVTEVSSTHYVFGTDDIYVHDGHTQKSIADERVRKYIFNNLDRTKTSACFVQHDSSLKLVYFAYVTKEEDVAFPGTTYANRAAVYNYANDTWSFMDLPNVCAATESSLSLTVANVGVSEDETPRITLMLSVKSSDMSESRVCVLDLPNEGLTNLPVLSEAVVSVNLERTGVDLDKESNFELRSYKTIKSLIPQVRFPSGSSGRLTFQLGAADQIEGTVAWQDPQVFDHTLDYKVDSRASGRYLALKVTTDTQDLFRWSGYDVETLKTARR